MAGYQPLKAVNEFPVKITASRKYVHKHNRKQLLSYGAYGRKVILFLTGKYRFRETRS